MTGRFPSRDFERLTRAGVVIGVMAIAACSARDQGDASRPSAQQTARTPPSSSDSARVATAAESLATARDQWNEAEIAKRLTEAGLVVTDEGKTVHHPGLHVPGRLLDVSGSELQIYVYESAADRRRDSKGLDTTNAGVAAIGVPRRPYFIITNNLIALHFTPRAHLAERVDDVLMSRHVVKEP